MRLLILFLLVLTGCSASAPDADSAVTWGLSFGECLGYCSARLVVSDDATATLTETGQGLGPRVGTRVLTASEQARLAEAAARSRVRTRTIGCPDCADGGAEYVEQSGRRVTFEHGGDAGDAAPLAEVLRSIRDGFPSRG